MIGPGGGRVGVAGSCPAIRAWIVSPACVKSDAKACAAPDDHFTVSPHCRVTASCRGCVGDAGLRPGIGAGIVSPAAVHKIAKIAVRSAPDDHLVAGPHCRVMLSGSGRVGGVRDCPCICAGIVSSARVHN